MSSKVSPQLVQDLISDSIGDDELLSLVGALDERSMTAGMITQLALGFAQVSVPLPTRHARVMDVCGTGGAPVRSFNCSTVASFVVSGAGVPVAKHGNRSSLGKSGSADVLEALGVNIDMDATTAARLLDQHGITFLFAPRYHPAMRRVAKARRTYGRRTVFNVLGPLLNPTRASRVHLLGVNDPALLDVMATVMNDIGIERAAVAHGEPGLDEVSIIGRTEIVELDKGRIERYLISPPDLGLSVGKRGEIRELLPTSSARLCLDILRGRKGSARDMVLLNAAMAIYLFGAASDIEHGLALAEKSLDGGSALAKLRALIEGSREVPA